MKKVLSILIVATMILSIFVVPVAADNNGIESYGSGYRVVVAIATVHSGASEDSDVVMEGSNPKTLPLGFEFMSYVSYNGWIPLDGGTIINGIVESDEWIRVEQSVEYLAPVENPQRMCRSGDMYAYKCPYVSGFGLEGYVSGYVTVIAETAFPVGYYGEYWSQIEYRNINNVVTHAWVRTNDLAIVGEPVSYIVTASSLECRSLPSLNTGIVTGQLVRGDTFKAYATSGTYYKRITPLNDVAIWVFMMNGASEYFSIYQANRKIYVSSGPSVEIRSCPTTSAPVLFSLPNNLPVEVIATTKGIASSSWKLIKAGNDTGWVQTSYLS